MATITSLIGKWKLVRDGSDFLPGLDTLQDIPIVLKLLGNNDIEFFKIEKKKYIDVEEIQFSYIAKNISVSRSYQLGTVNYEKATANDVTLASVQSMDENFRELTLVRLGPKTGQNSRETYRLDAVKDVIKLSIELTTAEGTNVKLIKYLTRFDTSTTENFPFALASCTNGWKLYDYWPSTVISSMQTQIVRVIKVQSQDSNKNEPARILEEPWKLTNEPIDINFARIPRTYGGKPTERDDFIEFIIQVTTEDVTWHVARRYNEFDALRHFLLIQNPHNNEFQKMDAKFPGKAMFFRKSIMDLRIRGLDEMLVFYLENAKYCRQNALDALCAFLQIPEHLASVSKIPRTNGMQTTLILPSTMQSVSEAGTPTPPVPAAGTKQGAAVAALTPPTPETTSVASPAVPSGKATQSSPAAVVAAASPPSKGPGPVVAQPSQPQARTATTPSTPVAAPPTAGKLPSAIKSDNDGIRVTAPTTATPSQATTATSPTTAAVAPSKLLTTITGEDDHLAGLSSAQRRLLEALGDGMSIIKHGRQGAPKQRLLRCNRAVTELFTQADINDSRKIVKLSEVKQIRLGSEVDPESPHLAQTAAAAGGAGGGGGIERRQSVRRASLTFGSKSSTTVHYGTSILRRTCKAEDMRLCISLILPDRTFDIQCQREEDLDLLYSVLPVVCGLQQS